MAQLFSSHQLFGLAMNHFRPCTIEDFHQFFLILIPDNIRMFKFENFWNNYPDLQNFTKYSWAEKTDFRCGAIIITKLRCLRKSLRYWSESSVGDIFQKKKKLDHTIANLDALKEDVVLSPEEHLKRIQCKSQLEKISSHKKSYWWQHLRD